MKKKIKLESLSSNEPQIQHLVKMYWYLAAVLGKEEKMWVLFLNILFWFLCCIIQMHPCMSVRVSWRPLALVCYVADARRRREYIPH